MDLCSNLIGPCATVGPNDTEIDVDVAGFIRHLILFESYTLQSIRLLEFPAIVAALGYDQTLELLSSNVVKIHCDALTVGQTGQLELSEARRTKGLLPLNSYSFAPVRLPEVDEVSGYAKGNPGATEIRNREDYVHSCLRVVHSIPTLSLKQAIKLKQRIVDAFVPVHPNRGQDTVQQLNADLRAGSPIINHMLQRSLKHRHDMEVTTEQLSVRTTEFAENDFRVDTNLADFGLDDAAAHKVVEHALLAVGGLNQRVEEMKTYNGISGCLDAECPLFVDKLGFVLQALRPGASEATFQRVVEIRGLPEFIPRIDRVDVARLLRVRESAEIREFRSWLATAASATDDEIRARVGSVAARMGSGLQSVSGRAARFLVTTGIGIAGNVAGGVAGAIDTFLVDKILPRSGVWAFVNKLYPSIFKARSNG